MTSDVREQPTLTLYTYFRSSCSARVRIALAYKGLAYDSVFVDLLKGEQHQLQLSPTQTVPALVVSSVDGGDITIPQSIAALEWLEERFPLRKPLLPTDIASRVAVRTLVQIVASDTQPASNLKVVNQLATLGVGREEWSKRVIEEGLQAYETFAAAVAGTFSVGDDFSLADVCLAPQVEAALRWGVKLEQYPVISRVMANISPLQCIEAAHWTTQPDTPVALRAS